jgi:predicted secreted hydrolase
MVAASCMSVAMAAEFPEVVPGHAIEFPRDEGSHPLFRTEWWYVTASVEDEQQRPLGLQITFFRYRPGTHEDNPSRFAPRQLLFAHAAISDAQRGSLLHDQKAARAGFGLVEAGEGRVDVRIDDWSLEQAGDRYSARIVGGEFAMELEFVATQPPMLQGVAGFSQKAPDPAFASYYYSLPQLRVTGTLRMAGERRVVNGSAWFDHEWMTRSLHEEALGWDWLGLNLDDGGALMVQRIRRTDGSEFWAGATWRASPDERGATRSYGPDEIEWQPGRRWRSPRTGIEYPVEWQVRLGDRTLLVRPTMDDQENDTRESTGTIYYEGAVRVFDEGGKPLGRGYLELTGYGEKLRL